MKENSIEEDIEVIESIIEEYENCCVPEIDMQVNVTFREKQNNALNHILSDYKRVLKENEIYKKNSEIMSKENLSTAEQLKVEIKENFRLKNQLENNRKKYQETYKDVREELKELKKENEELKISNKEIDKECSRLEKKEDELINENEHYKDLIYALETYYEITEEDLEKCMKNDR